MRGLRIGVIGGGLGGLAVGIAVAQVGHDVTVFEQAVQIRPVGAGISLWPNGVKVLSLLGLGDRLAEIGGRMDRMAYSDMRGPVLCDFSLEPLYKTVGQRAWPLPRAELQQLLMDTLGTDRVRLGVRCVGVDSDGERAVATFEGGETFEADLLIAADGVHSGIREWVVGQPVERNYIGYVNFNGLIPFDERVVPWGTWLIWVGDGKRASVMPAGPSGQLYTFLDIPMSEEQAAAGGAPVVTDELRESFKDWATPVGRIIDALDPSRTNRVPIYDVPVIDRWHRGRVVLMGDAVHCLAPDLGQGGCQALEDALVLAHYLSTTDVSVADALARYQEERLPRTAEMTRRARKRAAVIHGADPTATTNWYRELARQTGEEVIAGLVESVVTGPCR